MAYFKLKLLTYKPNQAVLETVISEFDSKSNTSFFNSNFTFTYDEKFNIHTNAQKELTFSLDHKLLINEEWVVNPFALSLSIGSQLCLTDRYNRDYLFIISNISHTFTETNIVYNISCADAFSYQLSRQAEGYYLQNDSSSEDFIGARNIDYWAKQIAQDCGVYYDYLGLTDGLYENTAGAVLTYKKDYELKNVARIIKKPYNPELEPTYFETFPFSIENSTANAALIALAGELGFMVCTYEKTRPLKRFFWMAPAKNNDASGLTYSPYDNLTQFGLDFSGDSLVTVMNVEPIERADEYVSVIPSPSMFFETYLKSPEWKVSRFTPGFFSRLLEGKKFKSGNDGGELIHFPTSIDNTTILGSVTDVITKIKMQDELFFSSRLVLDDNNIYLTIPIGIGDVGNWLPLSKFYNRIKFDWDNEYSAINIGAKTKYSFSEDWALGIATSNSAMEIISPDQLISAKWLDQSYPAAILIPININEMEELVGEVGGNVRLHCYNITEEEDFVFARIADQCPWLENRIIDFQYFYDNNVLSKEQYDELLELLFQNLRIINGQMLVVSAGYFALLSQKTEALGLLAADIDSVSAAFFANVVNDYEKNGYISDGSYFLEGYSALFQIPAQPKLMVDLDKTRADALREYADANQRFLRNINKFREYFERPVSGLGVGSYAFNYSTGLAPIEAPTDADTTIVYAIEFNGNQFTGLIADTYYADQYFITDPIQDNYGAPLKPIFDQYQGHLEVASKDKLGQLYLAANPTVTKSPVDHKEYKTWVSYYESAIASEQMTLNDIYARNLDAIDNTELVYRHHENYTPVNWDKSEWAGASWIDGYKTANSFDDYKTYLREFVGDDKDFTIEKYESEFSLSEWYYLDNVFKMTHISPNEYADPEWKAEIINQKGQTLEQYREAKQLDENADIQAPIDYKQFQSIPFVGYYNNDKYHYIIPQGVNVLLGILSAISLPVLLTAGVTMWTSSAYSLTNQPHWKPNAWTNEWLLAYTEPKGRNVIEAKYGDSLNGNLPKYPTEWDGSDYLYTYQNESYLTYANCFSTMALSKQAATEFANGDQTFQSQRNALSAIEGTLETSWPIYYRTSYWKHLKDINTVISHQDKLWMYSVVSTNIESNIDTLFDSWVINDDTNMFVMEGNEVSLLKQTQYINSAVYYPLKEQLINFPYERDRSAALKDISGITVESYKGQYLKITTETLVYGERVTYYDIVLLFREDNFFEESLSASSDLKTLDNLKNLYYKDSNQQIGLIDLKSVEGLYMIPLTDANFVKAASFNIDEYSYYVKENDAFKPIYTYKTLLSGVSPIKPYYWASNSYDSNHVADMGQEFGLAVNMVERTYDKFLGEIKFIVDVNVMNERDFLNIQVGDTITFNDTDGNSIRVISALADISKSPTEYVLIGQTLYNKAGNPSTFSVDTTYPWFNNLNFTVEVVDDAVKMVLRDSKTVSTSVQNFNPDGQEHEINVSYNGHNYSTNYRVYTVGAVELNTMSNGEFWYKYHSQIDNSSILNVSLMIESKLSEYWTTAYQASFQCEYFLPEFWQPKENDNYFAGQIIQVDPTTKELYLSNHFIPQVGAYADKGSNITTYYQIQPNLATNVEHAVLADMTHIKSIPALVNIFEYLDEDMNNWLFEDYGTTTYYHAIEGGRTWNQVADDLLKGSNIAVHFTGQAPLRFKLLTQRFINLDMPEYKQLLEEKQNCWQRIYNAYPGVILEGTYTSDTAIDSESLLAAAQYAFKDLSEPEKAYSLAMIDIPTLEGYKGQEIQIGDVIYIKAEDFIHDSGGMYKALTAPLFITDLSYDLRSDSNIGATVNSVKYQDKLIQQLVKLIR